MLASEGVAVIKRQDQFKAMAWLGAFVLGVWWTGFLPAIVLYSLAYLYFEAREPLWLAALVAALCLILVYGLFNRILNVPFLPGLLF